MFKVGDKVRVIDEGSGWFKETGIIETFHKRNRYPYGVKFAKDNDDCEFSQSDLELIKEGTMSQSIKSRIAKIEGWGQETNELLEEIGGDYALYIPVTSGNGQIRIYKRGKLNDKLTYFLYENQCEKNDVFKEAITWIAKREGKLEDTAKIRAEITALEGKIEELNGRLED